MSGKVLNNPSQPAESVIDYDIHGLVGIRLINPSVSDAAAVARQLGPLQRPLMREPDIVIRFVERLHLDGLQYVELNQTGFTADGFFILQSNNRKAAVRIPFDQVGGRCEIVCETGLASVPDLLAILNVTLLRKNCAPLHASAFIYRGVGVLAAGWAKGGKTEALLAFASQGATYVGDEWILLAADGSRMFGVPEAMRLWDWHLRSLPHLRKLLDRNHRVLFAGIHGLDRVQRWLIRAGLGNTYFVKLLRGAMPALKRQLNIRVEPRVIFDDRSFEAQPEKLFLLVSDAHSTVRVQPIDPLVVARRMAHSGEYEQSELMKHYLQFKFAFPDRRNEFLEHVGELRGELLCRALASKEAYLVRHPHRVDLRSLYRAMSPLIRPRQPMFVAEHLTVQSVETKLA